MTKPAPVTEEMLDLAIERARASRPPPVDAIPDERVARIRQENEDMLVRRSFRDDSEHEEEGAVDERRLPSALMCSARLP